MNTNHLFLILSAVSLIGAQGALAMAPAAPVGPVPGASAPAPHSGGCCHAAWGMKDGKSYHSKATGYFPDSSAMEGGYVDRKGNPLRTLQQFTKGKANFVSTAMDSHAFGYGQQICIPEINASMGSAIPFRVVDTGGAFQGKGTSRIDICTGGQSASLSDAVNRQLTIIVCE